MNERGRRGVGIQLTDTSDKHSPRDTAEEAEGIGVDALA